MTAASSPYHVEVEVRCHDRRIEKQRVIDAAVLAAHSLGYRNVCIDGTLVFGEGGGWPRLHVVVKLDWYQRWRWMIGPYARFALEVRIRHWLSVIDSSQAHAEVEVDFQ